MLHQRYLRLGWFLMILTVMFFIVTFCSGFRLAGWGLMATFTTGVWLAAGTVWGRVGVHTLDSSWMMLAFAALLSGVRHLSEVTATLQHQWVGAWGAQWGWCAAWVLLGATGNHFARAWHTRPELSLRME